MAVLSDRSEEIERRANAVLGTGDIVALVEIDRTMGRLGEAVLSFENAFVGRPNLLAADTNPLNPFQSPTSEPRRSPP